MPAENDFFRAVADALAADRLVLPTLPDVALRIRDCVEAPDASAEKLAGELSRDAAMATRILRVANSAAQGTGRRIESLQLAVARLGLELTRLLVTGFAVEQTFACKSPELRMRLRSLWSASTETAALARTLASHFTSLKRDLAMLAGLTYDIGALALIREGDRRDPVPGPAQLESVLENFQGQLGRLVLKKWDFPDELIEVPVLAADFHRWHEGPADYADVVTAALLQRDAMGQRRWWALDRARVPALSKLELEQPAAIEQERFREECSEAQQMFA